MPVIYFIEQPLSIVKFKSIGMKKGKNTKAIVERDEKGEPLGNNFEFCESECKTNFLILEKPVIYLFPGSSAVVVQKHGPAHTYVTTDGHLQITLGCFK